MNGKSSTRVHKYFHICNKVCTKYFHSTGDGCVILKMTVGIILMNKKKCVKGLTEGVQNQKCDVVMENVFQPTGDVIMMMTVVMVLMNRTVVTSNVK